MVSLLRSDWNTHKLLWFWQYLLWLCLKNRKLCIDFFFNLLLKCFHWVISFLSLLENYLAAAPHRISVEPYFFSLIEGKTKTKHKRGWISSSFLIFQQNSNIALEDYWNCNPYSQTSKTDRIVKCDNFWFSENSPELTYDSHIWVCLQQRLTRSYVTLWIKKGRSSSMKVINVNHCFWTTILSLALLLLISKSCWSHV